MDRKRKMLLLMIFKVFLKNKWKRRKLKFNRLLHDIRRSSFLKRKKKACFSFYFSNLFSCLEILPKTRSVWQLETEEKWFDNMWENRHSSDFQLQWKLDFQINGLNFEKLVDLVHPDLEKHDTQLRKAILTEKQQNS